MRPLVVIAVAALFSAVACSQRDSGVAVPGHEGARKTEALERAKRRAYDGAPPTIPHAALGASCVECHNEDGMAVKELGFAPPSPHTKSDGRFSRCLQCHVRADASVGTFVTSRFVGLRQDLRKGTRAHPLAPPRMPHSPLLRENCLACHHGPAAREEIRTPHPERLRCRQCHVSVETSSTFQR